MKTWLCERLWRLGARICFLSQRLNGSIRNGDEATLSCNVTVYLDPEQLPPMQRRQPGQFQ